MPSNLDLLAFGVIMLSGKLLKFHSETAKHSEWIDEPLHSFSEFHDNIRPIDFELGRKI